MAFPQNVLIVDGPTETAEVLKAVFEPQGLQVDRLNSRDAADLGGTTPSLVVLHQHRAEAEVPGRHWEDVPCIVIGTFLPRSTPDLSCRCLQEPFEYRDLIAAIDELLGG